MAGRMLSSNRRQVNSGVVRARFRLSQFMIYSACETTSTGAVATFKVPIFAYNPRKSAEDEGSREQGIADRLRRNHRDNRDQQAVSRNLTTIQDPAAAMGVRPSCVHFA
jgi:hypothetical protein